MEINNRLAEEIAHRSGEYIQKLSNHTSLITVTRVILSLKSDSAILCITVYPQEKEQEALALLQRNKHDLIQHLSRSFKRKRIPKIEIKIDEGEKHRQNIDTLINTAE
jgi:ribosome-binding factor A